MTIWSAMSMTTLLGATISAVSFGDMRDTRAAIILLASYAGVYAVARDNGDIAIFTMAATHFILALMFYTQSLRWYGDFLAMTWVAASSLSCMALLGILNRETGLGMANTLWHWMAVINHLQNIVLGLAVYARRRDLIA